MYKFKKKTNINEINNHSSRIPKNSLPKVRVEVENQITFEATMAIITQNFPKLLNYMQVIVVNRYGIYVVYQIILIYRLGKRVVYNY